MNPEEMVQKILEKEFPDREPVDTYPTEGGFAHDTFFVDFKDESFVLKINGLADLVEKQNQDWNARFETEPYVLDIIRQKALLTLPSEI